MVFCSKVVVRVVVVVSEKTAVVQNVAVDVVKEEI
jgi:hypothetical protein